MGRYLPFAMARSTPIKAERIQLLGYPKPGVQLGLQVDSLQVDVWLFVAAPIVT